MNRNAYLSTFFALSFTGFVFWNHFTPPPISLHPLTYYSENKTCFVLSVFTNQCYSSQRIVYPGAITQEQVQAHAKRFRDLLTKRILTTNAYVESDIRLAVNYLVNYHHDFVSRRIWAFNGVINNEYWYLSSFYSLFKSSVSNEKFWDRIKQSEICLKNKYTLVYPEVLGYRFWNRLLNNQQMIERIILEFIIFLEENGFHYNLADTQSNHIHVYFNICSTL